MRPDSLALIAAIALAPVGAGADTAVPVSRFAWQTDLIIGLSGIELDETGTKATLIGDRGYWAEATIQRTGLDIVGVELHSVAPILGPNGYPVASRRVGDWSDAEGLAISPDGRAWVSFERWAHVWRYEDGLSGDARHIPDHETFGDHADNWQLEATAISPDGVIYTFSEKPLLDGFPVYRLSNEGWVIDAYLPERDLFAIVGADFDEAGDLYLLERKLVMGLWWQNRIRRIRLDGSEDRSLWTSERGDYGNLEGLALWRRGDTLMMTAISDNNGGEDTPTEFVDFELVPAPPDEVDEDAPEG